jgi:hypothetical protein
MKKFLMVIMVFIISSCCTPFSDYYNNYVGKCFVGIDSYRYARVDNLSLWKGGYLIKYNYLDTYDHYLYSNEMSLSLFNEIYLNKVDCSIYQTKVDYSKLYDLIRKLEVAVEKLKSNKE